MKPKSPSVAVACRVSGLTKVYGKRQVLGPIDLEINEGEKIAIIGPSGAGKSTFLKLIVGEIEATSGSIEIAYTPLMSIPLRRRSREIGLMHQHFDLIPQLTARKNIEAGNSGRWSTLRTLASLLLPIHDNRSEDFARSLEISNQLDVRTSLLSGGQQQRVAFARLLTQSPNLYLADEPVASLDPALADKVAMMLCGKSEFPGEPINTVLANLHSPELAVQHFDRVIGLAEGQIKFDKASSEVTDQDTAYVYETMAVNSSISGHQTTQTSTWGRD
jgi:phosphonate transport system ATP-binding protein